MKILIDDREDKKVINEFKRVCECEVVRLPVGDVVYKDVVIEHKEVGDFVGSLTDGRAFEQAKNMMQFKKRFYIISGNFKDVLSKINENAILGGQASLAVRYGLQIICVANYKQYCKLCVYIIMKAHDGKSVDFQVVKSKQTKKDRRVSALTAIEGVSFEKATALLEKFGNLTNIILADEKSLEEVKGVGGKLSKRIKEFWE